MKHIATFLLGAALAAIAPAPDAAASGKFLESAWHSACIRNKSGGALMRTQMHYTDRNGRKKWSRWSVHATSGYAVCHSLKDVPDGKWVSIGIINDGEVKFFGGGKVTRVWFKKDRHSHRRDGKKPARHAMQDFHAQLYRPRLKGKRYYTDNCGRNCYDADNKLAPQ